MQGVNLLTFALWGDRVFESQSYSSTLSLVVQFPYRSALVAGDLVNVAVDERDHVLALLVTAFHPH